MYNPDSNTWVQKATQPTSVSPYGGVNLNGLIYCFGSSTTSSNAVYNPSTDTWQATTGSRYAHYPYYNPPVATSSKIYLLQTYSGSSLSPSEVYDPSVELHFYYYTKN
jgi:hypothetical protein